MKIAGRTKRRNNHELVTQTTQSQRDRHQSPPDICVDPHWASYRWSVSKGEGAQGALFGIVATLLLFFSVTLHELGHSFQTLKYGVKVRGITLMPMGGLAQMEEIPEDPNKELRIAMAGPLVNFGIAALLVGVGAFLNARALLPFSELAASLGVVSWSRLLAYLTYANLLLGAFDLIPAFPTWKGNSVITAHVWDALNQPGPFAKLKDLKYGDQIKIHAFGQVYTYEIRESTLISPFNIAAMLKPEEKSWLTLITCEDYKEALQKYSSRRMARVVLVSVTLEK